MLLYGTSQPNKRPGALQLGSASALARLSPCGRKPLQLPEPPPRLCWVLGGATVQGGPAPGGRGQVLTNGSCTHLTCGHMTCTHMTCTHVTCGAWHLPAPSPSCASPGAASTGCQGPPLGYSRKGLCCSPLRPAHARRCEHRGRRGDKATRACTLTAPQAPPSSWIPSPAGLGPEAGEHRTGHRGDVAGETVWGREAPAWSQGPQGHFGGTYPGGETKWGRALTQSPNPPACSLAACLLPAKWGCY